ncbi:hypothetical protein Dda_7020 [Drechslerella dactyloides]|uniref:Uncharacterized protein n=1 Tax=Drechslerella dactyloides TaxID=74499 RepID=A0AAD6IV05_DREDA|nr:hypothetical protein Dda_7020 [Drechslerella dactyloides]
MPRRGQRNPGQRNRDREKKAGKRSANPNAKGGGFSGQGAFDFAAGVINANKELAEQVLRLSANAANASRSNGRNRRRGARKNRDNQNRDNRDGRDRGRDKVREKRTDAPKEKEGLFLEVQSELESLESYSDAASRSQQDDDIVLKDAELDNLEATGSSSSYKPQSVIANPAVAHLVSATEEAERERVEKDRAIADAVEERKILLAAIATRDAQLKEPGVTEERLQFILSERQFERRGQSAEPPKTRDTPTKYRTFAEVTKGENLNDQQVVAWIVKCPIFVNPATRRAAEKYIDNFLRERDGHLYGKGGLYPGAATFWQKCASALHLRTLNSYLECFKDILTLKDLESVSSKASLSQSPAPLPRDRQLPAPEPKGINHKAIPEKESRPKTAVQKLAAKAAVPESKKSPPLEVRGHLELSFLSQSSGPEISTDTLLDFVRHLPGQRPLEEIPRIQEIVDSDENTDSEQQAPTEQESPESSVDPLVNSSLSTEEEPDESEPDETESNETAHESSSSEEEPRPPTPVNCNSWPIEFVNELPPTLWPPYHPELPLEDAHEIFREGIPRSEYLRKWYFGFETLDPNHMEEFIRKATKYDEWTEKQERVDVRLEGGNLAKIARQLRVPFLEIVGEAVIIKATGLMDSGHLKPQFHETVDYGKSKGKGVARHPPGRGGWDRGRGDFDHRTSNRGDNRESPLAAFELQRDFN